KPIWCVVGRRSETAAGGDVAVNFARLREMLRDVLGAAGWEAVALVHIGFKPVDPLEEEFGLGARFARAAFQLDHHGVGVRAAAPWAGAGIGDGGGGSQGDPPRM